MNMVSQIDEPTMVERGEERYYWKMIVSVKQAIETLTQGTHGDSFEKTLMLSENTTIQQITKFMDEVRDLETSSVTLHVKQKAVNEVLVSFTRNAE